MDLSLALATGIDIPIPECQLVVHQPTIKEIGAVGEKEFFTAIQCLCISNQMDRTDLEGVSNFQIFMTIMSDKDSSDKKNMVMPSHARSGPDWSSLCSNWMTRWERFHDTKYRDNSF